MTVLVGFVHTLLAVLAISGIQKLLRPDSAAAALRAGGLVSLPASPIRTSRNLSRLLGLGELTIAAGAFAMIEQWPSPQPLAVRALAPFVAGVVYLGFNWFIARLSKRDASASCGCFGGASTPPGAAHRRFNLAAALLLFGTAIASLRTGQGPTLDLVLHHGWSAAILYPMLVATCSALFILGPALLAGVTPPSNPSQPDRLFHMTDRLTT